MKITYMFKGKVNGPEKDSIFKTINVVDGKEVLVFNYARHLMLVETERDLIGSQLPITLQTCKESAKATFKEKRKGIKNKSMCISFPLNIVSFAVDVESASISVLTGNGKLFLLSIKTLVDHLTSLPKSAKDQAVELDVGELLSSITQSLPSHFATLLTKAQDLNTYFEKSSLNILFMSNRSLFKLTTIAMPNGVMKWKQSTLAKLESSVYTNDDRIPKIITLRIQEPSGLSVCPLLRDLLFGEDSSDVVLLLCLPSGHVFYVNSRTSEKNLICDMKQPLIFSSTVSVSYAHLDSSTPSTVYNSKAKASSKKLMESFLKRQRNKCIIFVGALGKLIFLFPPEDEIVMPKHHNQVTFEHQLPLPVTACACKNDILFVSDSKVINVYQLTVSLKEKLGVTDGTEVIENIFVPGFELVRVIPVCQVIKIEVLRSDPIVLFCLNNKSHVFMIDVCEGRKPSLPVASQNLDTLVEKLASKQTALNNVKEVSMKLNKVLRDTKGVVAIVHKHNKNNPLIGSGKESCFPLRFVFNTIHCNSERKLLVSAKLHNNSVLTLPHGWYLSIQYHHQFISTDVQKEIRCRNECFRLPALQPNTSHELSFLINPCFLGYAITMDVYLHNYFHSVSPTGTEYERRCRGIGLFMMSHTVNVAAMCGIVDSPNIQISAVPSNRTWRVEQYKQQQPHQQQYSCVHPIPEVRINFLYNKFNVENDNRTNSRDSVSDLLFKYLMGRKTKPGSNSMTLVHVHGSCVELRLVENKEKTHPWNFNLDISSPSLRLLTAFQHFVSHLFCTVPNEGEQFKRIFESRLSKLKELSEMVGLSCDTLEHHCKEDAIGQLHSVTVELRSFIL